MAARRERSTCVAIAVLLLAAYTNAADTAPSLDILPSGETQTKPIGSSILLTCRPKVDDISLVKDMQWLDPSNKVIESLKSIKLAVLPIGSTYGTTKPAMYTELHQDGSLSLFFNSLQESEAGKYTCKGTYARNVALSKSVTIDTIIAITWDNAPQNQYPILGEDFDIQCQVRARPSPSVDWLHNGELIKTNDHYVINTYALKIKNVQESDDGIYTCRASVQTTGELKERAIRVEVHVRPTIEEIPSPVNIIEGENANIRCKANGKPPPMFTWIKSLTQQNLSNADRFGVDPVTGVLTITNVNREDAGEYQCSAINAAGIATTNIQVNVIVKPKIMEFLNVTVVEKKSAEIKCKAFGRPPPEVTFRKQSGTGNKQYVIGAQPQDDRIVVENDANDVSGETVGTLSIFDALTLDDGLYECIAKNKGGITFKNGHLTVEFPPTFRSMPNKTFWSWDQKPVNLTCIAESIPNATIRWTIQDHSIEGDDHIKQIGNGPTSILRIIPTDNRYYTRYKCIAMNTHGTRERSVELREATKPKEFLNVKMTEVTATTITFDLVPPVMDPDLAVTTIDVQYKTDNEIWQNAMNRTWSVGSLYVIEGLKPQTPYEFRFAGRNRVGLGNWGNYYRETTPGRMAPQDPRIVRTTSNLYEQSQFNDQYELSWVTPADNGEPIDMYEIKYCQIIRVSGEWEVLENTCETTPVKTPGRTRKYLKNLKPDAYYMVELRAHNIMGFSKPGYVKFRTAKGDTNVLQHQSELSSGTIIGIALAAIFVIFIIIDATCCCVRKTGIIYYTREQARRKPVDEEDAKLGSLYGWRFPLPYCDQKMANVAGVTAIQESGSGKNTIRLVKHTAIDEKEPLKEEKKITPIIDSGLRRETSVTFDGKRSVSKTGFVGKDSAV
ncbi:fasciclin-2 isoform X3 [Pogonomyrmex barbatus]|uniref:Fasciclin-2 isoform X3 n=1 Tax=Pogonomyrmex barbatus TaxID=144034 RepID=A0A6I9WI12_9HYME|nr:fasciclin-2 isoform X3 [Pogonomyrmex barbatus]